MATAKIESMVMARGSFGVAPINPRTGKPRKGTEHTVLVWLVKINNRAVAGFATKAAAQTDLAMRSTGHWA